MTLYSVDWCPECILVKQKLASLGVTYDEIKVPDSHSERTQVQAASNQTYVPVLIDDDTVLTETTDILYHLQKIYG